MMLIAGTLPYRDMPLTIGPVKMDGELLVVDDQSFACTQGTGAMITAALATTDYLKLEPPQVMVVGDIGDGKGSRQMYHYLIQNISELAPDVLSLHYCLPIMELFKELCQAIKKCSKRPILIADAGAMYGIKGAGLAPEFDIMTPDPTEIAFLADPKATHPAYIAHHLFESELDKIPEWIATACRNRGAAKLLLVKGKTDYVASDGKILATITEPDVPVLEAIGGTGDTITGLVSALVYAGLKPHQAAIIAARTNRMAGKYANPTPATRVKRIIDQFPAVFKKYLCQWSGVCTK